MLEGMPLPVLPPVADLDAYVVREDCAHYRGDRPCVPHKLRGKRCSCDEFVPRGRRVLIIKLGALGDVIRTTPLLRALKAEPVPAEVHWLSAHPDILPACVDYRYRVEPASLLALQADHFDAVYSLDKDREAAAIGATVSADARFGFGYERGRLVTYSVAARHKLLTGLDDGLNRQNTRSYPQEIFDICGL